MPAISLSIYVALMALARPIHIEGLDVDRFSFSLPERVAIALNSPVVAFVWNLSSFVDYPQWWVKWCFGAVPVFLVWYSIGWWTDRYELPKWLRSAAWLNWPRSIAVGLLGAVLFELGAHWLRTSHELSADWMLDLVAAFVFWPILILTLVIEVLKGGVQAKPGDP